MIKALLGGTAALCLAGPAAAQVYYVQGPQVARIVAPLPVVGLPPNGYVQASPGPYGDVAGYGQGYGYGQTISVPSKYGYDVVTTLAVVGYARVGRARHGFHARPFCCAARPNAVLTKAYVPFLSSRPIKVIYTPQPYVTSDASYR